MDLESIKNYKALRTHGQLQLKAYKPPSPLLGKRKTRFNKSLAVLESSNGVLQRLLSSTDNLLGLMSRSRTEENTMHTWGTVSDLVSSKDSKTAQNNSVTVSRAVRGLLQWGFTTMPEQDTNKDTDSQLSQFRCPATSKPEMHPKLKQKHSKSLENFEQSLE